MAIKLKVETPYLTEFNYHRIERFSVDSNGESICFEMGAYESEETRRRKALALVDKPVRVPFSDVDPVLVDNFRKAAYALVASYCTTEVAEREEIPAYSEGEIV